LQHSRVIRGGARECRGYPSAAMPVLEVQEVSLVPGRTERLLGFEIESPSAGSGRDVYVLHVIGWTVGRDSPAAFVEVLYNRRLLRTVPVRGPRADVAAAVGVPPETNCVFHALIGMVGLKLEATVSFAVVLEDGARVPAGSISVRREPLRPEYEPRVAPLIVTTLGRSGSTWLMQMLASHRRIVTFRNFPYESTPAKYWLHALRVLSEPVNMLESAHPDTFHNNLWWVGNNPYHNDRVYEQSPLETWFARTHIEGIAAFMQRTIDDWYETLARVQAQPDVAYFAEKHMWPNYLPVLTWELYPRAKEIFLVRDFRDMARSILAFDQKRGYPGFGRPEDVTDDEYLRGVLKAMAVDLMRSWQTRSDRAHLVRYEDLVLRPRETVTGMLEYLEIDSSPETVDELIARGAERVLALPGYSYEPSQIEAHRTVTDLEATIGRWRTEGDESLRALAGEVFADPLRAFGYD
jgi:hypothetical protein